MLGLSSGLMSANRYDPRGALYYTYTSDFTNLDDVGVNKWNDFSIQGGDLTFEADQDIPGGSGGGWLKITYPNTNQTNNSGIDHQTIMGDDVSLRLASDICDVSLKMYLYNDGNNFWEGTDNVNMRIIAPTGGQLTYSIAQDEEVSIDTSISVSTGSPSYNLLGEPDGMIGSSGGASLAFYFHLGTDNPQANAVFYIKDVVCKFFRG